MVWQRGDSRGAKSLGDERVGARIQGKGWPQVRRKAESPGTGAGGRLVEVREGHSHGRSAFRTLS